MKIQLQERLPNFELCYDNILHNKVFDNDLIMVIPEGKKCLAWFSTYDDQNVCYLIDQEKERKGYTSFCLTSFSSSLSYGCGTLLYGTLFKYKDVSCFNIEDILYYKGSNICKHYFGKKLNILHQIFQNGELSQTALNNKYTIFGLPLIGQKFNDLLNQIELLPYKVSKLNFKYLYGQKSLANYLLPYYKPGNRQGQQQGIVEKVFKVVPDIQNDIYMLHELGSNKLVDVALIPDYKTSVMMNKLFRNIKENANLDALEESDDEDEFENMSPDKYVDLNKSYKMKCLYNLKFKKWVPLSKAT